MKDGQNRWIPGRADIPAKSFCKQKGLSKKGNLGGDMRNV